LIFEKLEPAARSATEWKGPKATAAKQKPTSTNRKPKLVYLNEFLMFLMRIRLKPNLELLSLIFGWSIGHISHVFATWLDLFVNQLSIMIKFPSPMVCRLLAPPHIAAAYPRLRCIVDCTEVFIQSPSSPTDRAATYSRYKKHHTVKTLVAILANGYICYLPPSWAGRTSDNYIFYHSGILDFLESGDQLLADRGFLVGEELMRRGVEINIPPGATGIAQFPTEDVTQTKRIANVRVHVERAIGRMKTYNVLSGVMPVNNIRDVDKCFKAVSILVNLQGELVR
jgi:hypothetical protein